MGRKSSIVLFGRVVYGVWAILFCTQTIQADITLKVVDTFGGPMEGVSCSQGGGASATSNVEGFLTLTGIVSISQTNGPRGKLNFTQIPLSFDQQAEITIINTNGQVVFDEKLKSGEKLIFPEPAKGVYYVRVLSPNYSGQSQVVNLGKGLLFESVESERYANNSFQAKLGALPIQCSKDGYPTKVFQIQDGSNITVDFGTPIVMPLFNASTLLEPDAIEETDEAIITHWADRARDRHAREDEYATYDHYLTHYWEHRTAQIKITDYVAKGGDRIEIDVITEWQLDAPEFRAFYRGINTVAEYYSNISLTRDPTDILKYSTVLNYNPKEGRAIQPGDRVEIEVSQFLLEPPVGRENYYGTTVLYIAGQGGFVPWEAKGVFGDPSTELEDSYPLPKNTWMGGGTTLPYQYSNEPDHRFLQMTPNLASWNGQQFVLGRRVLHTNFIDGSHDEPDNPVWSEMAGKAGGHYVNVSCNSCHLRNGRALPPAIGEPLYNYVMKVGDGNGKPHPQLGNVFQPQSTGVPEGLLTISNWIETNGLRKPEYRFTGANVPTQYSARATPQLVGLGLLEAIPEEQIEALADPFDYDGDGISGKRNVVTDLVTNEPRLGRFGWKAGKASVAQQIAGAFNTDMGVMTSILPNPDCGAQQTNCGPTGNEVPDEQFQQLVDYVSLLGVAARRDYVDPLALQGERLFTSVGCISCHVSEFTTSPHHPKSELRNQTIHPYTDLLLHDMGPGLADNLPEGRATGSEWRTPPLWSIGLTAGVSFGEAYLHDGRARTIEEAILWHGGEAEASANSFKALSVAEQSAIVKFIQSL